MPSFGGLWVKVLNNFKDSKLGDKFACKSDGRDSLNLWCDSSSVPYRCCVALARYYFVNLNWVLQLARNDSFQFDNPRLCDN